LVEKENKLKNEEKKADSFEEYHVFCAKCNQFFFNSKSIKKRGINFLTYDQDFIENKITTCADDIREFKTEKHVGKILCKNQSCGSTIGPKIEYNNNTAIEYGYVLNIKSIKFKKIDNESSMYIQFKHWKNINFRVDEIPF
jgi:hypothetical protein